MGEDGCGYKERSGIERLVVMVSGNCFGCAGIYSKLQMINLHRTIHTQNVQVTDEM